jgi:hypothetical protein
MEGTAAEVREKIVIEKERLSLKKRKSKFMILTADMNGNGSPGVDSADVLLQHDLERNRRSNGRGSSISINVSGCSDIRSYVRNGVSVSIGEYTCIIIGEYTRNGIGIASKEITSTSTKHSDFVVLDGPSSIESRGAVDSLSQP